MRETARALATRWLDVHRAASMTQRARMIDAAQTTSPHDGVPASGAPADVASDVWMVQLVTGVGIDLLLVHLTHGDLRVSRRDAQGAWTSWDASHLVAGRGEELAALRYSATIGAPLSAQESALVRQWAKRRRAA